MPVKKKKTPKNAKKEKKIKNKSSLDPVKKEVEEKEFKVNQVVYDIILESVEK